MIDLDTSSSDVVPRSAGEGLAAMPSIVLVRQGQWQAERAHLES